MPATKVSVSLGISLLILVVFGFSLNREFQNYRSTADSLREIVLKDALAAERFLASRSDSEAGSASDYLAGWKEYLDVSSLKAEIEEISEESLEKLDSALVTMKFAYGLEKYPALARLRESLGALTAWNDTTPYATLFQKATASEIYAASRLNESELEDYSSASVIPETVGMEAPNEAQVVQASSEEETVAAESVASDVSTASASELFEEEALSMTAKMPRYAGNSFLARKLSEETATLSKAERFRSSEKEVSLSTDAEKSVEPSVKKMEISGVKILEIAPGASAGRGDQLAKVNSVSEFGKVKVENSIPTAEAVPTAKLNEVAEKKAEKPVEKQTAGPAEKQTEKQTGKQAEEMTDERVASSEGVATEFFPELPTWRFTLLESMKQGPTQNALGVALSAKELSGKMTGDFSADSAVLANSWLLAQYVAPEKKELEAAFAEIKRAAQSIDQIFAKAGTDRARSWKELLKWDDWKRNPTDPAALNALYRQLSCGAYGLELKYFVALRDAVERYLAINNQQLDLTGAEERFQTGKKDLAKLILMFRESPDSQIQNAIKDMLNWMATMGQSLELVQSTRGLWKNPNVIAHIDGKLFERLGTQEMERTETTADSVSSATVRSTSQFKGVLSVKPVANEKQAEMSIELAGTADSRSKAYAKSVVVSSTAKSQVKAVKTIRLGEDGFETSATKVGIQTNSQINDISDAHNRRVVEHAATRRVYAQKPSMERQAKAQSSRRLQKQLDGPIDQALTTANEKMAEMIYQQLGPRGVELEEVKTFSGENGVHAQSRLVCRDGMGASAMPEAMDMNSDVYFAIHETAFQELFIGFLDGVNLNETARKQFKALSPDWVREALNNRQDSEQNSDWAICFAQNWPITVSFKDGRLVCRIHCEKIMNEGKEYPALDVTIAYDAKVEDGKLVMTRQGEIEILPPDFNPAEGKRLPGSIVSLRRIMAKRLQNAFKPEFVMEERALVSEPNEQNERFANLYVQPAFVQVKNGWLQVGANIVEKKR